MHKKTIISLFKTKHCSNTDIQTKKFCLIYPNNQQIVGKVMSKFIFKK